MELTILKNSLLAASLVSLISLVGILMVGLSQKKIKNIIFFLVSFSAGSLMGGAFFHLIPEAIELSSQDKIIDVFKLVTGGFITFYIMERVLRWRHCHSLEKECEIHHFIGYQNLLGDGLHNFIDGLIIFTAFSVNNVLGLATTISIILHEIPQEIGDFGVLIYSGFSKKKALFFNFISAVLAILGVLAGFLLSEKINHLINFLIPFAAGGFIYIAASDLIPEIHREKDFKKSLLAFIFFVIALVLMFSFVETK